MVFDNIIYGTMIQYTLKTTFVHNSALALFCTFFKLYKWHQIAQRITYRCFTRSYLIRICYYYKNYCGKYVCIVILAR